MEKAKDFRPNENLTAYTVEFGVETNDSKLNKLKDTTEFFPVGK